MWSFDKFGRRYEDFLRAAGVRALQIIDTFEAPSLVRIRQPSLLEDDTLPEAFIQKICLCARLPLNLPVSVVGEVCLGTCEAECQTHRGMPGSFGKARLCCHIQLFMRQHGEHTEVPRHFR